MDVEELDKILDELEVNDVHALVVLCYHHPAPGWPVLQHNYCVKKRRGSFYCLAVFWWRTKVRMNGVRGIGVSVKPHESIAIGFTPRSLTHPRTTDVMLSS